MIMTIFSEICLALYFLIYSYLLDINDKIEEFTNIEKRKTIGYLILFSILGALLFGFISLLYDIILNIISFIQLI